MIGACAKTTVTCTLIACDGRHYIGTNYCKNAQSVCPRAPGEGYEKCVSICNQAGHAEIVALGRAGQSAKGARAYVLGHTYACRECQEALYAAGVISISVGIVPEMADDRLL